MTSSPEPVHPDGAAAAPPDQGSGTSARTARAARHQAIREQVAFEEDEAGEAEAAEKAAALDVAMHLRIDQHLDAALRQRAAAEHIATSALVRRLLRQALLQASTPLPAALSAAEVEDIARRVAREELQHH